MTRKTRKSSTDVLRELSETERNAMRHPLWTSISSNPVAPGQWCGDCIAQRSLRCGEECGRHCHLRALCGWCGFCMPRVLYMCSQSCYSQRLLQPYFHRMFADRVVATVNEAPCSWCGLGACDWCENCDRGIGPASAICRRCEASVKACRFCFGVNYVKGAGSIRRPAEAARRYEHEYAVQTCVVCSVSGRMQKCADCRIMCYCGSTCQRSHWSVHKPICKMLQGAISVNFVYEWQRERISSLRAWSFAQGDVIYARFSDCFGPDVCDVLPF
jgi:hypothetical protein